MFINSCSKFPSNSFKIPINFRQFFFRNFFRIWYFPQDFLKPAIHYSLIWRIGYKIIFSPNKILLAKTRQTCCCTLFVVCYQFSRVRWFFFRQKNTLCSSTRPLPRHKSCVQRTAKNLFAKHGKRLLYIIHRTSFSRRFAPISLLFANSV